MSEMNEKCHECDNYCWNSYLADLVRRREECVASGFTKHFKPIDPDSPRGPRGAWIGCPKGPMRTGNPNDLIARDAALYICQKEYDKRYLFADSPGWDLAEKIGLDILNLLPAPPPEQRGCSGCLYSPASLSNPNCRKCARMYHDQYVDRKEGGANG